jgi:hypothetical protein
MIAGKFKRKIFGEEKENDGPFPLSNPLPTDGGDEKSDEKLGDVIPKTVLRFVSEAQLNAVCMVRNYILC